MHLHLSPLFGGETTTLHVAGDVLTHDGTPYDLADVPEGGEGLWPDSPLSGPIRRIGGVIHASVRVVMGPDAAPDQPVDPAHWIVPEAEGDVAIPYLTREV